jgi:hypothetical protein
VTSDPYHESAPVRERRPAAAGYGRVGLLALLGSVVLVGCGLGSTPHQTVTSAPSSTGADTSPAGTSQAGTSQAGTDPSSASPVGVLTPPPAKGPTGAAAVDAAIRQQLRNVADGRVAAVVRTKTGYQAATVDRSGGIQFWLHSTGWHQVASSTYPFDAAALAMPRVSLTGAVLQAMHDATFVITGNFSGDSSVNAAAFTDGVNGWGAITLQADGRLVPSGSGLRVGTAGLFNALYFSAGRLETATCSQTLPISACGGNSRVLRYWTWKNGAFSVTATGGLPR